MDLLLLFNSIYQIYIIWKSKIDYDKSVDWSKRQISWVWWWLMAEKVFTEPGKSEYF
jgi:hypothetical protein